MGVVTDEERALAEDESMSSGEGVVDTLITKGVLVAIQVSQAKAAQFGAEFVEIAEQTIEDDVISSVPRSVAHQYKVVPLYHDDLSVTVAMSDPSDLDAIDALGQAPRIKWINDVLLGGRKVSGVITSTVAKGECIEHAVLGIGVNVATTPKFPSGKFVQPPGSLRELAPDILITLPAMLAGVAFSSRIRHLLDQDWLAPVVYALSSSVAVVLVIRSLT